jgi:outer membrane lipoprotein SlyB
MRINNKITMLFISLAVLISAGCANSLTSDSYSRAQTRGAMEVQMGVIEYVREVKIEGTASGTGASVGSSAGGLIGLIGGSNTGNGKGSLVGSIVGAVAGGIAGHVLEQKATEKDGIEVTVRMDGGKLIAVTQEKDPKEVFAVGDKVHILNGGGVTRVTKL